MTSIVAERLLYGFVLGIEVQVTVRLWTPEHWKDGSMHCRYTFHSDSGSHALKDGAGYGVDGMQALVQALSGVGLILDKSGIEWSMFSEDEHHAVDGIQVREDGFPRPELNVMFYGSSFRKRIQDYVASERLEAMKSLPKPTQPAGLRPE